MNDAWKLYAGTTWTRWSRLKDITVNNKGVTAAGGGCAPTLFGTIKEEQNWHDTWAYAIGTSYQLNKQVGSCVPVDLGPVANQQLIVRHVSLPATGPSSAWVPVMPSWIT
jgi:long-subunit fatty acid transport protein